MSNGVRYTPTFAMPSEYERQAMEARRRRRIAEMLAAQAYQPQDVGVAPIPGAAPLVQGLQAFLAARQERKAEEAEEKAKKAGQKEFADYIRSFEPEERTVGVGDVAAMEAAMPQLDETGRLTHIAPSAVAAPNQRLMPAMTPTGEMDFSQPMQMQVGGPLTMAQRRARALEGFESTNPMVQQFAAMQFEKSSPRELALELEKIDPTKVDMASVAEAQRTGDISKIRGRTEPVKRTGSDDFGGFVRTYYSDGTYKDTPKTMAPSGPKDERLVPIKGPDGKTIYAPESRAVGKEVGATTKQRPMSGGERMRVADEMAKRDAFAEGVSRTSYFKNLITNKKLPLSIASSLQYKFERSVDPEGTSAPPGEKPAYVNYYSMLRFVDEQVNTILQNAKGTQTEGDALSARQQILDNPNNEAVVLSALDDLERTFKKYQERAQVQIDYLEEPYREENLGNNELSTEDRQALEWANANPNDPRSAQIKRRLGVR